MAARLLPLELIDKCIGSRLWIIMKGDKVGIFSKFVIGLYVTSMFIAQLVRSKRCLLRYRISSHFCYICTM